MKCLLVPVLLTCRDHKSGMSCLACGNQGGPQKGETSKNQKEEELASWEVQTAVQPKKIGTFWHGITPRQNSKKEWQIQKVVGYMETGQGRAYPQGVIGTTLEVGSNKKKKHIPRCPSWKLAFERATLWVHAQVFGTTPKGGQVPQAKFRTRRPLGSPAKCTEPKRHTPKYCGWTKSCTT